MCSRGPELVAVAVAIALWVPSSDSWAAPADSDRVERPTDAPPEGLTRPEPQTPIAVDYAASLSEAGPAPAGEVKVKYVVGVDGVPRGIKVVERLHPKLDALALEAIVKARFSPATYHGEPVEVTTATVFRFEPPDPSPPAPEAARFPLAPAPKETPLAAPVGIRGRLLEGGQRQPIANASVIAIPGDGLDTGRVRPMRSKKWREVVGEPAWTIQTRTDDSGAFELRGVPDGRVVLVFVTQGFERLEYAVDVRNGEIVEGKYYQTRLNTNPYRTVVTTERERPAEVTRREITTEELSKIPGSQGDPIKGIQNFPGMARTPFGIGQLVIRGAAPGDSAVYLGGHELPQLFHFGGITSVFNADLISSIAYEPSNFDSAYGDATGGLVAVTPSKPRRDSYHGYVDADVFDASALVQGPVGRGSFAVSARRSYIDFVLRGIDGIDLAPRYWDYQGVFDYPIGPGELGVRLLGSDDKFIPLSDAAGDFDFAASFHRADFYYKQRMKKWSFLVTPSFAYTTETLVSNDEEVYNFSLRAQARYRANRHFGLLFGTETRAGWANIALANPPVEFGPPGEEESARSEGRVPYATPAAYATANFRWGKLRPVTVSPGVRVTAYATPIGAVTADPRLNANWDVTDNLSLKAGAGIYSQGPSFAEIDDVFGNPGLSPERSVQTSLGMAYRLPYDMRIEVTGFYKHLWDLVSPSDRLVQRDGQTVPERFGNTGIGHSYGAEVLFRRDFSARIYGWLAYTLSQTQIRERPGEPLRPANFDQTHILNLVAGYKLPRNWNLGLRFRLTSGNPTTPFANGIYDSTSGTYTPFAAPEQSGRLPLFHQLDLRVDKTWTMRRIRIMAYLDIQNVYYAKNTEFLVYSYDFEDSARLVSLPILPSLGLRLDF